jgi:hypothetical protein
MPDTVTSNYNFVQPEIGGSPNTWGNKLNLNWAEIDTQLKRVDDRAFASIPLAGTEADEPVTGNIKLDDDVVPSDPKHLVPMDLIKQWIMRANPIGIVETWAGTLATIPHGFALCDGTIQNGIQTPNLIDRFILGGGPALVPGGFGGSKTHNHGGLTGGTALTIAQMPNHNHGASDSGHYHNIIDPGHSHGYFTGASTGNYGDGPGSKMSAPYFNGNTTSNLTGIAAGVGYASISVTYAGSGNAHNHTIAAADHTPPYYILAFIVRVKYPWDA